MKQFACGDVVAGCEASWVCASEDEVLVRVARHAQERHGLDQISDELMAAVRAAITEARP